MDGPKKKIEQALHQFARGNLAGNAKHLLNVLGYESQRTMRLEPNTSDGFLSAFNLQDNQDFIPERALVEEWESIDFLFQLTEAEIGNNPNLEIDFGDGGIDEARTESYLFFAIKLSGEQYSRTQLSQITREMNKAFGMPAMILFQHGEALTFAVIDRRLNKLDESKDVLLKATLIKDINFADPHRAHIDILSDLSIDELYEKHKFTNFPELHEAWRKTLDTSELNKRFYKEIANWYFWAVDRVTFPDGAEKDKDVRNKTSIIRLITRLIFVWFIKEKGLVSNDLFKHEKIKEILTCTDDEESTYYKAILQNLFFATLNQEMNTPEKPDNRKFRGEGRQHYNITSLYRYKRYFAEPNEALKLFESIPFLNGGLFECLDKPDKDDPQKILRVDGFSDRDDVSLHVPNWLFFSDERTVDLNAAYGTRGKQYKVHGLVKILDRYKFTVTENTPIEEEIALDPELLGRVFENLLAAYNPETGATARKQTGSFYTPREIVDYMTDESLIAYLKGELIAYHESQSALSMTTPPAQMNLGGQTEPVQTQLDAHGVTLSDDQKNRIEDDLRELISYKGKPRRFSMGEIKSLIRTIDGLKILDPACGSGAFPMGVLQKLVFLLGRLDARNEEWRQRQIDKVQQTIETAERIEDSTVRENTISDLESEINNINDTFERNEFDYGRKLFLIENCIYGVDIQPIAVQISKLRFFISLVVDQQIDDTRENRGVRALPNLETRFVAANALIGLDKPAQMPIRNPKIDQQEIELADVRRKHFTARTPKTKDKYRKLDAQLRATLSELLRRDGFPSETTEKIAFWDPYEQNVKADWLDPEWMFNTKEGFDLVIGNPPYVQLQKNGGKLGRLYAPCNFDTFMRTGDIYCLFYEKANQLSRDGGYVCFITSNKWMRAAYGKKLRDYLARHTQPIQLLDMGPDVFDATVDTNILLLQNLAHANRTVFKAVTIKSDFDKQAGSIAQYLHDNETFMDLPAKGESWTVLSSVELALKRKIEHIGKPIKDWNVKIYRGIVTGCNEAFVIDEVKRKELILQDPKSAEVIKPLLRGRDIKRYHVRWGGLFLINTPPALRLNIDVYHAVRDHLQRFGRDRLEQAGQTLADGTKTRKKTGNKWFELQDQIAYHADFEKEKIIYPNMTKFLPFMSYDPNGFYTNQRRLSLSRAEIHLKYLTGIF